jgi:uncharacterized membrane protein HdeD (DUF308 family)
MGRNLIFGHVLIKIHCMKKNMGLADSILRTVLAVTVIFLHYNKMVTGTSGTVLLILAIILLFTSLSDYCPLYAVLGIRTCQQQKATN